MLRTDDDLTAEQKVAVLELTKRGSSELASRFAAFIRSNAAALDRLPENAAMVALLNVSVGLAVMLFDQFGVASNIEQNAAALEDRFRAMTETMAFGGAGTSAPSGSRDVVTRGCGHGALFVHTASRGHRHLKRTV
jgi:hypothetical protein